MLAEPKLKSLNELVKDASRDELIWISGYIAALAGQPVGTLAKEFEQNTAPAISTCTVVYGTETGNSKKVATQFSVRLKKQGIQVKLKSMDQYRVNDLQKESCLLVVMSTHGDGEPPAASKKFYEYLHQQKVDLSNIKYGVLALGDSAYPLFCKAGLDVDTFLHQHGAERLIPAGTCDTDFEEDANEWIDELINHALKQAEPFVAKPTVIAKPSRTGKKIYDGTVATAINLNDRGSNKETYHVEIMAEEAVQYAPGDSFGIVPRNSESAVLKVLELLALNESEILQYKDQSHSAQELFINKVNINYLPERLVQQYAKLVNKDIPSIRMDMADLLRIYPSEQLFDVQQFISILEPIAPRLYSIASSPAAHGEKEIHLTVSKDAFEIDGHKRYGLCSDFLAQLKEGDAVRFYIQKNSAFRLPAADADSIMIGPGTGIAPFRSFLFERDAQGADGRNWLFFGEQHFVSDFLYQTDMLAFFETGLLTRFNTAFSRDQQEKIYVQHRMLQQADELFNWLQNGAHIYICGKKDPMSVDVEQTLINIIGQKKNINEEAAGEYLNALKEAGRYHKDVY